MEKGDFSVQLNYCMEMFVFVLYRARGISNECCHR
jgi:hypothetical protein